MTASILPEPYKIKAVEPVRLISKQEREKAIREAGYNTFLLRSRDVYIDLLTDSGTNAMSQEQWAALMRGDEAYAGAESYYRFQEAVEEVYGFKYVIPAHQGRGAENILSKCLIKPGDFIPGNMYFTTTRLHQELAGGTFVDVIIDEAHDPKINHPFKGNIDLKKLTGFVKKTDVRKIPYITIGAPVNMAGGQPVSMDNLNSVSRLARSCGIKVVIDGARLVENAYFIQQREKGWGEKPVKQIVREICALADAIVVSAKKDAYVNIGGFLATNDQGLCEEARNLCVVYEGLHTYGGLAGRDLEALAQGIRESVERDDLIAHRISQVRYLWENLNQAGVALVNPAGGHAVFIDATAFLPHVPRAQFPAQSLTAEIYADSGVRAMERGIVSAGRDLESGENHIPKLELVRLALPRRVYTQSHLDYVCSGIRGTLAKRDHIRGVSMVYEPRYLRFFQARFALIPQKIKSAVRA
ncbi:MAG: tyrosine phenol-lyase [Elusimicrobia bacterium]|nr:tyrosine phenol-lyase [Elusimicrobiota bacterium]